jgi:hypothetical protein
MWQFYYSLEIEMFEVKNICLNDSVKVLALHLDDAFAHSVVRSRVYKGKLEPMSN